MIRFLRIRDICCGLLSNMTSSGEEEWRKIVKMCSKREHKHFIKNIWNVDIKLIDDQTGTIENYQKCLAHRYESNHCFKRLIIISSHFMVFC